MADRVYSEDELALIKEIGLEEALIQLGIKEKSIKDADVEARDTDMPAAARAEVHTGKSIFGKIPIGTAYDGTADAAERDMTDVENFGDIEESTRLKLIDKAVEEDLAKEMFTADSVTWVRVDPRDVMERSMKKQGLKINKKDLTNVRGVRNKRTRFNDFNTNHRRHYASGSYLTDGGGPRFQGPAGGASSTKFVITTR